MGFNIKNNYGPNIEVNAGGKVTLVQGKDGLWHTAEGEEAYYEEIKEDGTLQPAPTEEQRVTEGRFFCYILVPADNRKTNSCQSLYLSDASSVISYLSDNVLLSFFR